MGQGNYAKTSGFHTSRRFFVDAVQVNKDCDRLNQIQKTNEEDEALIYALQVSHSFTLSITLSVAVDLGFFDIISGAGPEANLSASEVVSQITTRNPKAASVVDRMLNLLATHSLLTCKLRSIEDGVVERVYGIAPSGKFFVSNCKDGDVLAPFLSRSTFQDKWLYMKDAVLEDIIPFEKVHGMPVFEFTNKNPQFNNMFNNAMSHYTRTIIENILKTYTGFEDAKVLVDVGGGLGTSVGAIVSKYPHIKGINFDMPHVVENAPDIAGVEHVGGDMFQSVPSGDTIIMKSILHDFNDEQCITILENCYKALPENGKLIIVTVVLSEAGSTSVEAKFVAEYDINMLSILPGRERTIRDFKALAKATGFQFGQVKYGANAHWVIELMK